ncbi:MAG: PAS-domain containing protein [Alphaproteobacteria bacterium]|nr:PAS-domain containing protein [Alphaproteobacteria bacterium]
MPAALATPASAGGAGCNDGLAILRNFEIVEARRRPGFIVGQWIRSKLLSKCWSVRSRRPLGSAGASRRRRDSMSVGKSVRPTGLHVAPATAEVRRSPARPAPGQIVVLVAIAAIAAVWIGVGAWLRQLQDVETTAARRELVGHAGLLAEHAERTVQSVDLVLSLLVSRVETALEHGGGGDPVQLHDLLRVGLAGMPQVRSALVLAADGRSIGDATVAVPRPFNGSDRAYFTVHREGPDADLFIGDPMQSRINQLWAISLSKRLTAPDGRFAGVVVAAVDPDYFASLHARTEVQEGMTVTLVKRSGVVLATTHPDRGALLGTPAGVDPAAFGRATNGPSQGFVDFALPGERRSGLTAFATSRTYPIVVLSSRTHDAIIEETSGPVMLATASGAVITALIVALAALLRRQLQSMDRRFRDGIETISDGFLLWDADERLVAWNSRYEGLFPEARDVLRVGVPHRELTRRVLPRIQADVGPERIEGMVAERMARFREPRGPWELRLRDERIVEIEETRSVAGEVVTILRDVTARRRHEAELERALAAEREASQLHRQFVAMASHEFRTPLAIIDGGAQRIMSQRGAEDAGLRSRVDRIRGAVTRMTGLIDRLLSSARLDEGAIKAERTRLDLASLLREVGERQRQISPEFDLRLDLPDAPLAIDGDAHLLDQVFTNLLSNAVKFSGRSRCVEMAVAVRDTEVSVAIRDSGVGIHADEMDRLFTRFFRARTAMGTPGTGIGLHLSNALVRMHGGRIDACSELAKGSVMTVTLPRAASPAGSVAAA